MTNPLIERPALDVVHDDEVDAAFLPDVVDGDNVRVVEGRCGPGFLDEAPFSFGTSNLLTWKDLQRDEAVQMQVPGLVDDTDADCGSAGFSPYGGYRCLDFCIRSSPVAQPRRLAPIVGTLAAGLVLEQLIKSARTAGGDPYRAADQARVESPGPGLFRAGRAAGPAMCGRLGRETADPCTSA